MRRYAGSETATHYRKLLSFGTDANPDDPTPMDRTLSDLVSPTRTGSAMDVCNAVSRAVGDDAADWGLERLLRMATMLERQASD